MGRIADVAEALSGAGGLTQAEVMNRTGFSGWAVAQMAQCLQPSSVSDSASSWGSGAEDRAHRGNSTWWRGLKSSVGASDAQIAAWLGATSEAAVRATRLRVGVRAAARHIDTVAAEDPTSTSYLYLTHGAGGDTPVEAKGVRGRFKATVVVLGGGGYHIGSSVEFDYSGVMAVRFLRREGYR